MTRGVLCGMVLRVKKVKTDFFLLLRGERNVGLVFSARFRVSVCVQVIHSTGTNVYICITVCETKLAVRGKLVLISGVGALN